MTLWLGQFDPLPTCRLWLHNPPRTTAAHSQATSSCPILSAAFEIATSSRACQCQRRECSQSCFARTDEQRHHLAHAPWPPSPKSRTRTKRKLGRKHLRRISPRHHQSCPINRWVWESFWQSPSQPSGAPGERLSTAATALIVTMPPLRPCPSRAAVQVSLMCHRLW